MAWTWTGGGKNAGISGCGGGGRGGRPLSWLRIARPLAFLFVLTSKSPGCCSNDFSSCLCSLGGAVKRCWWKNCDCFSTFSLGGLDVVVVVRDVVGIGVVVVRCVVTVGSSDLTSATDPFFLLLFSLEFCLFKFLPFRAAEFLKTFRTFFILFFDFSFVRISSESKISSSLLVPASVPPFLPFFPSPTLPKSCKNFSDPFVGRYKLTGLVSI